MSTPRVKLPALAAGVDQMWHVLMDLSESLGEHWTLVGGQMAFLHALEHGVTPVRLTEDGDVIADIRSDQRALDHVIAGLTNSGLVLEGISAFEIGHRYVRDVTDPAPTPGGRTDRVVIDVLAPDGVGQRANLSTTGPARTIEAPGGTQALQRSRMVEVTHGNRVGNVPCPSLLGAIVAKSAAVRLPGNVERHLLDVALLYALVEDPFALKDELNRTDRVRLRCASHLDDERHPAWLLLPPRLASRGQTARAIMTS